MFVIVIFFACHSKEALHDVLTVMSNKLNRSVPVMLDAYTQFDGTSVTPDNHFQYFYTVINTSNPDSLIAHTKNEMSSNIHAMLKSHPDLRIFVKNKVPLEYIYKDSTKRIIHTIKISPDFYSK